MPNTRFIPEGPTVFVVGAGFSADLGFPPAADLLFSLGSRLPISGRRALEYFLQQQYPRFQADEAASYPSIEELLAKLMVLEQHRYSVANGPPMTSSEPRDLRRLLLSGMARWFMERQRTILQSPPLWLQRLREWVLHRQPTFIAFNWDLVLDQLLYGGTLSPQSYGFGLPLHVPALLKPHGSLNWHEVEDAAHCRPDRNTFRIGNGPADRIMAYRNLGTCPFPPRGPYAPALFPEAFQRNVGAASFREVDRACIERMSKAAHVIFLGYPMPATDLHARSLFLSGLLNRGDVPTPSVLAINRDAKAGLRTSALLGKSLDVVQERCSPMEWISANL